MLKVNDKCQTPRNFRCQSWYARLKKAADWLDGVGDEMPSNADAIGLHRHNWLEAQILRREAEALILRSREK